MISVLKPEMLLTDLLNHWVTSLQTYAQEFGYKSRLEYVGDIGKISKERSADGFIILGGPEDAGIKRVLTGVHRAHPIIYTDCENLTKGSVSIDNAGGTASAVRHLVDLGHRRIAYFGLVRESGPCMERYYGFIRQMNDLGFSVPSAHIVEQKHWPVEVDDTYISGEQLTRIVEDGVTGIVCSSDINAIGAIKLLKRNGYCVPDDVSIVGFDETLLARAWDPPLTTVKQDIQAASKAAIKMIIYSIKQKDLPTSIIVDAPLIVRGTTGYCRV